MGGPRFLTGPIVARAVSLAGIESAAGIDMTKGVLTTPGVLSGMVYGDPATIEESELPDGTTLVVFDLRNAPGLTINNLFRVRAKYNDNTWGDWMQATTDPNVPIFVAGASGFNLSPFVVSAPPGFFITAVQWSFRDDLEIPPDANLATWSMAWYAVTQQIKAAPAGGFTSDGTYEPPEPPPPEPPPEVLAMQSSLTTEMSGLLDGKTPETVMPMFSAADHATPAYTRNPDWLLAGVEGANSLCVACPTLTGDNIVYRKVVKLTPHVCMVAWHARWVSQTYRWVTWDNQVIEIATAPLPESGLEGYTTEGNCLQIGETDIGLYRMAQAIPESIDCLPIVSAADHAALAEWASQLDIPLMGLLGGATTHPNRVASPRRLSDATKAKSWTNYDWFEAVANYDSGSLLGYLLDGKFAACIQVLSYGVNNAGSGPDIASYISQINQAIADLGYPDEQLTVASIQAA